MRKKKEEVCSDENKNLSNMQIIEDICKNIEDADVLDVDDSSNISFVSTGNLAMDFVCSGKLWQGGVPLGRITEIYGESSTGKTIIGTHILQNIQKMGGIGILIDSESAYSASFAKILGIDTKQLIYLQPNCLEDCFIKINKIINYIRSNSSDMRPVAIVYDSIAASPSRKEIEKVKSEAEIGSLMGHRALVCSDYLRNIVQLIKKQQVAVVIINQVRNKIGIMFGDKESTAGGGKALPFYCSVRLKCMGTKKIEDNRKIPIGVSMKIKNVKNKITNPFREVEGIELIFNKGINPLSGLLNLLDIEGKVKKSAGWYKLDDGTKFQSKEFKDILINHPELIGADSSESISKFLEINSQSLNYLDDKEIILEDIETSEDE